MSMASASSMAAIVYSGPVNIPVPDNIDGVYMNVVTGQTGTSGATVGGWDINPYSAVAGDFHLWSFDTTTWLAAAITGPYPQTVGTSVGPAGTFFRPGGNNSVGGQVTLNSTSNYFGIRFTNENTGATNFGWIQMEFGADAGTRSIIGYAYENTGIAIPVGTTPVSLQNFSVD